MGITFEKRQKEMKRMEKQREKAARRAQRKLEKRSGDAPKETEAEIEVLTEPPPPAEPAS